MTKKKRKTKSHRKSKHLAKRFPFILRFVQLKKNATTTVKRYRALLTSAKTRRLIRTTVTSRRAMLILFASIMLVINMLTARNPQPAMQAQVLSSTTTAEQTPIWCEVCRIEQITIPSTMFMDKKIAQMSFDVSNKTWPTPISGIATPKETIPNNIIVFGHSKWFGRQSHFSRISMLRVGDEIFVTDQFDKTYTFTVSSLDLVDRFNGDAVHAKQKLQLTLLTSARNNGEWLLPTQIDQSATDHVQDAKKYAIFIVTAKPKPQSGQ